MKIILAAGGSGGHVFPAQALALELRARSFEVVLLTDSRGTAYAQGFPGRVTLVSSGTPYAGGFFAKICNFYALFKGFLRSFVFLKRQRPGVIVGFGGYPSVPPLAAAFFCRIPIVIHEQNAVMGRANAFLERFAEGVAVGAGSREAKERTFVGNPVRSAFAAAAAPYPAYEKGQAFRLLIFGGSQGARILSDVAPQAISCLPQDKRAQIEVTQQARPEDQARVKEFYAAQGITACVAAFFDDIPERMAQAHLIVSRSGAATIAELAFMGRPAILIPLPGSLDQDQRANARFFVEAGGGRFQEQETLTPEALASIIEELMDQPELLRAMAVSAQKEACPAAASLLADLVERVLGGGVEGKKD